MELKKAKYIIIKFIPNIIKEEPINIGLILHSPDNLYIKSKFSLKKIELIQKFNEEVNINLVKNIMADLELEFNSENWIIRNKSYKEFNDNLLLEKIYATYSNQLQFTQPRSVLTNNLEEEFEVIFSELVFKEKVRSELKKIIEERTMKKVIREKFNNKDLIKNKIIVENHKEKGKFGDDINIDFKFLNGKVNLINNLSFEVKSRNPVDYAKLWLTNYEEIKFVAKKENEEKRIRTIYTLPKDCEHKSIILDCLKEGSDEIIDFYDSERIDYFIKEVENIAHV